MVFYRSGRDYDPDYEGAIIGLDINFLDGRDEYCSRILMKNIYNGDKYKNIQFEDFVRHALGKIQELMECVQRS